MVLERTVAPFCNRPSSLRGAAQSKNSCRLGGTSMSFPWVPEMIGSMDTAFLRQPSNIFYIATILPNSVSTKQKEQSTCYVVNRTQIHTLRLDSAADPFLSVVCSWSLTSWPFTTPESDKIVLVYRRCFRIAAHQNQRGSWFLLGFVSVS